MSTRSAGTSITCSKLDWERTRSASGMMGFFGDALLVCRCWSVRRDVAVAPSARATLSSGFRVCCGADRRECGVKRLDAFMGSRLEDRWWQVAAADRVGEVSDG